MAHETDLQVGDAVRVIDGPFADFVSPVRSIDLDRGRVQLTVDIFGDPTTVDVPLSAVVRSA